MCYLDEKKYVLGAYHLFLSGFYLKKSRQPAIQSTLCTSSIMRISVFFNSKLRLPQATQQSCTLDLAKERSFRTEESVQRRETWAEDGVSLAESVKFLRHSCDARFQLRLPFPSNFYCKSTSRTLSRSLPLLVFELRIEWWKIWRNRTCFDNSYIYTTTLAIESLEATWISPKRLGYLYECPTPYFLPFAIVVIHDITTCLQYEFTRFRRQISRKFLANLQSTGLFLHTHERLLEAILLVRILCIESVLPEIWF